jgi:hypothetical protein
VTAHDLGDCLRAVAVGEHLLAVLLDLPRPRVVVVVVRTLITLGV